MDHLCSDTSCSSFQILRYLVRSSIFDVKLGPDTRSHDRKAIHRPARKAQAPGKPGPMAASTPGRPGVTVPLHPFAHHKGLRGLMIRTIDLARMSAGVTLAKTAVVDGGFRYSGRRMPRPASVRGRQSAAQAPRNTAEASA